MKALELFAHAPELLPVVELVEAHRSPGLVLSRATRHGICGPLHLTNGLQGHSLVTETLRLAVAGHHFLALAHREPLRTVGQIMREVRPLDAELSIYLEGR